MQIEKIVNHITNWLTQYARNAGANGFVIGVSGGIDSALTSALCARTRLTTLCVSMPIHQHPDQLARANEHITGLLGLHDNVSRYDADLTRVFEVLKSSLPASSASHLLSMANTRSRLRMVTLYALGQSSGLLVAGTGNKIEDFGVGFFTKYGDGGVDVSPIAGLTKSQVYLVAGYLGISSSILKANPTDGLWDTERTDEIQLGATYPELEWAMDFYKEKINYRDRIDETVNADISLGNRQKEVLAIFRKFYNQNLHKMKPVPVCEIPGEWIEK